MKITKNTKLSECSIFLTEEIINSIAEKVPDEFLQGFDPIINGTIGNFIRLMNGDQNFFKDYFFKDNEDVTVYEYAARLKHLRKEIEKVVKYLNSLSIAQTDEEKQAAKGVNFPSFAENMLIYCQTKFFLRSFHEAESVLLSDFILHKKNDLSLSKYERNLRAISDRKQKLNLKKQR